MAFKMMHKVKGISYPEGYWKIADDIYENSGKARVVFHFYGTKEAREEDVKNFFADNSKEPVTHTYWISGEKYTEIFNGNSTKNQIKAKLYEYAKEILEGVEPLRDEDDFILLDLNSDPQNYLLINGEKTKVDPRKSFFDGATDA